MIDMKKVFANTSLLDLENAFLDLFEKNRITIDIGKTGCWQILLALYEDELIEEPHRRETIIENIERQKDLSLENILGQRRDMSQQTRLKILNGELDKNIDLLSKLLSRI